MSKTETKVEIRRNFDHIANKAKRAQQMLAIDMKREISQTLEEVEIDIDVEKGKE